MRFVRWAAPTLGLGCLRVDAFGQDVRVDDEHPLLAVHGAVERIAVGEID
jgi:hypothetical protein